ncbi:hypothetical protein PGTUg99_022655 [Puccinia graminis f. sp. tritici]|uniref:Uncharacterized protein n=1 Tax=Puccinia graminis f. sp. tritici TaxID=56615 RepID=A0A5B0SBF8_PUCGR|nr:hypothetical protein PGTUg99_022655 [Puccinia graminis f. sp. tritici]
MVTVDATIHTMCFNYFLHKDGCVNGAAGSQYRCGAKAKYQSSPVPAVSFTPPRLPPSPLISLSLRIPSDFALIYNPRLIELHFSHFSTIC